MILPKMMGVLNITPDSFSDGGKFTHIDNALSHVETMVSSGIDIIDVGGESTRPGANYVDESTEISRVVPIISAIRLRYSDLPLSIDTTKSAVALAAVEAGANIVNDVSAGELDNRMFDVVATLGVEYILMHMQGQPRSMQTNPTYTNVVENVYTYLEKRIDLARKSGITNIIADVGIGFGKTLDHNLSLLRHHREFEHLQVPLLLGISRKRFIGMVTSIEQPEERDAATFMIHALMSSNKIAILRVHNLEYARQYRAVFTALYP